MKIRSFLLGHFSPKTWQLMCVLLIIQFQGMLVLAWLFRSPHVAASTPFRNLISTLGQGRGDGNLGAWIFMSCFCTFALLLIPWHLHLARRVSYVSKTAARALGIIGLISLTGVACVGIFDEQAMGLVSRDVSRFMHGFGATTAFFGHCVGAFLSWCLFASVYARSSMDRRSEMPHPGKLLVSVLTLVSPLVLVVLLFNRDIRDSLLAKGWGPAPELMWQVPFWQWSLMLSLMFWLYSMGRWYPTSLAENQDASSTSVESGSS